MSDGDPIYSSHDVDEASAILPFSFDEERIMSRVSAEGLISIPRGIRQDGGVGYIFRIGRIRLFLSLTIQAHIYAYIYLYISPHPVHSAMYYLKLPR